MEIDELDEGGSGAGSSSGGRRRSSRTTVLNSRKSVPGGSHARNGHGAGDSYRGERRSTRLGNAPPIAFDDSELALLPAAKRARSSLSAGYDDSGLPDRASSSVPPAANGNSAQTGPGLVPVAAPPGKKRSKYWYYTVEQVHGANGAPRTVGGPTSEFGPASEPPRAHVQYKNNGYAASAPSEAGVSLINGMEGVELTESTESKLDPDIPNHAHSNGEAATTNGFAKPPVSTGSGSAMQMSDDDS